MVWEPGEDPCWMPPRGGLLDTSHQKEASGQKWDLLERLYICLMAWECLGDSAVELEEVAGERGVWRSFLRLLTS